MPVETDAERALFLAADEFGCSVVWTRDGVAQPAFDAIFDAEYQLLTTPLIDSGVEGAGPQILCRESDLPAGAAQDDQVAVTDPITLVVTTYRAVEFKPDGTGMTVVRMQKA